MKRKEKQRIGQLEEMFFSNKILSEEEREKLYKYVIKEDNDLIKKEQKLRRT